MTSGAIQLVPGIRDPEPIISESAVHHSIAGPPILLDQFRARNLGTIVDVEVVTHRAETEVMRVSYVLLVSKFLVKDVANNSSAYVVRECHTLGRMNGDAFVVAMVDAVG